MREAIISLRAVYDEAKTDANAVTEALDKVFQTALGTHGVQEDCGAVEVSCFDLEDDLLAEEEDYKGEAT